MSPTAPRATVRLLARCTNACVFCAQDAPRIDGGGEDEGDAPLGARAIADALADARARGALEVTFVGGEPTAHPGLREAIARARAAGFTRVGIQSHARRLADPGFTAALADAGLTDVQISVHGASPAVHDYHTGVPQSLAQSIAGVGAARASGLTVVAATVLTRSNYRVLAPQLPQLLAARGVSAWLIELPHAAGRAASAFDRVMPRLGLALPFALHALDVARGAFGLAGWIRGAPFCLLGHFAARLALPAPARAYGAACAGCPAREAGCPGLDPVYLARFGGDELARLAGAAPELAPLEPARAALARMFVGPGALADAARVEPATPARERVALPVLGRVQPARGEVPAGAPRRSGEALREILPGLFDGKDPARGGGGAGGDGG